MNPIIPIVAGPGYVAPSITSGELNDKSLNRFLNTLVSGLVASIPSDMVFPRWQPEPPNQPAFGTDWAAVGVTGRTRDRFAAVFHFTPVSPALPYDVVVRNEILDVLCSFYGPDAEANAELLAMGLSLAQNREQLFLNGFGLVEVGDTINAPDLVKERWIVRQDVPIRLRRQQIYQYPIPNIANIQGGLLFDNGMPRVPLILMPPNTSPALLGFGQGPFGQMPFGGSVVED